MTRRRRREAVWFYNLDNGRPDAVVNQEIKAILSTRPAIFAGCEATGLRIDDHPEYRRVRDTSTRSRSNMVLLVRKDLPFKAGGWIDFASTWPRTEGPGTHEPRSFPHATVLGQVVAVVHLPPENAAKADWLQAECIDALAALNPDIAIGDFNGRKGDPGRDAPDALARRIRGRTVGVRIDCAVVRNGLRVRGVKYPTKVGKIGRRVRLLSDHHHALRFDVYL